MTSEPCAMDEFYFQWHVTERCNKRCRHCYQNEHYPDDLPLAGLQLVLGRMEEALIKWGRKGSLSFTGGEPLVRRKELFILMQQVDQVSSFEFYALLTNGSLILNDVALALKNQNKLRRVQVSLEGATPETKDAIRGNGSYVETLNSIRTMKSPGLHK